VGLVQTFGQLLALRLLLGLFECGLFPGISLYLTGWYRVSLLSVFTDPIEEVEVLNVLRYRCYRNRGEKYLSESPSFSLELF
jgi:hypothetical protein